MIGNLMQSTASDVVCAEHPHNAGLASRSDASQLYDITGRDMPPPITLTPMEAVQRGIQTAQELRNYLDKPADTFQLMGVECAADKYETLLRDQLLYETAARHPAYPPALRAEAASLLQALPSLRAVVRRAQGLVDQRGGPGVHVHNTNSIGSIAQGVHQANSVEASVHVSNRQRLTKWVADRAAEGRFWLPRIASRIFPGAAFAMVVGGLLRSTGVDTPILTLHSGRRQRALEARVSEIQADLRQLLHTPKERGLADRVKSFLK